MQKDRSDFLYFLPTELKVCWVWLDSNLPLGDGPAAPGPPGVLPPTSHWGTSGWVTWPRSWDPESHTNPLLRVDGGRRGGSLGV